MNQANLWTKEFVISASVNFLIALNFYLLMIITSEFAMKKFNLSPGAAGFAASIFIIGALISRAFTGKFIASTGYKNMLYIGLIAGLVMSIAYFGINSIIFLFIIRFFHGAAFGISTTSTATIASDIIPWERRGEGIGYFSLSQILATAIGPFLGIFLSQLGSYKVIFAACTIAAAISLSIVPMISLPKKEFTAEQKDGRQRGGIRDFVEAKAIPISLVCLLIYMCYSSLVSFLTVYAKEINLADAARYFFLVYSVVILISRPMVGRLFDAKNENTIMYPAVIVFALGMFLFSQSYYSYMLLFSAVLVGLGFGAIVSSTQTIAVKVTSPDRLGLANSTYYMLCDIGMGIGPLAVGLIIPFTGYRGMYTIVAAIALACTLLYYLLHGKKVANEN
ncbi:MAG: MFS transporter [Syntrophomonadaceae bacterium]|jgi:MFS family permease|nr:MFS transporter [Syntrophomonadaceae bacterium]